MTLLTALLLLLGLSTGASDPAQWTKAPPQEVETPDEKDLNNSLSWWHFCP